MYCCQYDVDQQHDSPILSLFNEKEKPTIALLSSWCCTGNGALGATLASLLRRVLKVLSCT